MSGFSTNYFLNIPHIMAQFLLLTSEPVFGFATSAWLPARLVLTLFLCVWASEPDKKTATHGGQMHVRKWSNSSRQLTAHPNDGTCCKDISHWDCCRLVYYYYYYSVQKMKPKKPQRSTSFCLTLASWPRLLKVRLPELWAPSAWRITVQSRKAVK